MNYFFKKRQSRLVALLLAVCMVAAMFAGCQSGKPEEPSDPSEESLPAGLVEVKPTETMPEATEAPTEPANENMATVTDQLNVRSSPSTGAKIIGYLDPGTQVEIIKTETYMGVEWALIREGWIVLDYVEMNWYQPLKRKLSFLVQVQSESVRVSSLITAVYIHL